MMPLWRSKTKPITPALLVRFPPEILLNIVKENLPTVAASSRMFPTLASLHSSQKGDKTSDKSQKPTKKGPSRSTQPLDFTT